MACHFSLLILCNHSLPFSVMAIEKQKNAQAYDNYSYEYTLLKPFAKKHDMYDNDHLGGSVKFPSKNVRHTISMLSSSERVMSSRRHTTKSQSVFD